MKDTILDIAAALVIVAVCLLLVMYEFRLFTQ